MTKVAHFLRFGKLRGPRCGPTTALENYGNPVVAILVLVLFYLPEYAFSFVLHAVVGLLFGFFLCNTVQWWHNGITARMDSWSFFYQRPGCSSQWGAFVAAHCSDHDLIASVMSPEHRRDT